MAKLIQINRSGCGFIDAAPICAETAQAADKCVVVQDTDAAVMNAGAYMAEGQLTFRGDVGPCAAKGMKEGILIVEGNAGEKACASMQGGLAIFRGDVESGFGTDMRRGVAVVYGKAKGDLCTDMLGGTVLFLGGIEDKARLCAGMNRGTVILPSKDMVPDGFQPAADVDIMFLRVLFRELQARGAEIPEGWMGRPFTRWRGDMGALGKGEILTPAE